jgi:hypothetical protein
MVFLLAPPATAKRPFTVSPRSIIKECAYFELADDEMKKSARLLSLYFLSLFSFQGLAEKMLSWLAGSAVTTMYL